MEDSILKTIKKILGVSDTYTVFDLDIITHINSTFAVLQQLGIGPEEGFSIEDDIAEWSDFIGTNVNAYNLVKSYMALKVRVLFDTPGTSYLIEATNKQIAEYEWRLSTLRETLLADNG